MGSTKGRERVLPPVPRISVTQASTTIVIFGCPLTACMLPRISEVHRDPRHRQAPEDISTKLYVADRTTISWSMNSGQISTQSSSVYLEDRLAFDLVSIIYFTNVMRLRLKTPRRRAAVGWRLFTIPSQAQSFTSLRPTSYCNVLCTEIYSHPNTRYYRMRLLRLMSRSGLLEPSVSTHPTRKANTGRKPHLQL